MYTQNWISKTVWLKLSSIYIQNFVSLIKVIRNYNISWKTNNTTVSDGIFRGLTLKKLCCCLLSLLLKVPFLLLAHVFDAFVKCLTLSSPREIYFFSIILLECYLFLVMSQIIIDGLSVLIKFHIIYDLKNLINSVEKPLKSR